MIRTVIDSFSFAVRTRNVENKPVVNEQGKVFAFMFTLN
jgi:hypothetical protein